MSTEVFGMSVTSLPSFCHVNNSVFDPCNMPQVAVILWPIDADSGNTNGWTMGGSKT